MATYVHCAAHRLNLAVVSACKIQVLKNVEAYIGEIASQRWSLQQAIDVTLPSAKVKGCLSNKVDSED